MAAGAEDVDAAAAAPDLAAAEARLGALTQDRLLGGRLSLWQPKSGYRAATDPVFLAAAVAAGSGESVLELGIGAGAASLCLNARVPGLALTGIEIEPGYAALARANAAAAGARLEVIEGDVTAMPATLRARRFDHVILNPPYHAHGPASPVPARDRAHREGAEGILAPWLRAALKRVRPRGTVTLIHRAERLPEILAALSGPAGALRVLPLAAREGRPAARLIVSARSQVATPFALLAPLVLHEGAVHAGDHDHFTPAARAILRDGTALDLGARA
ncbi:MAG: methyltransferase domain-containing protein [Pseudomonadota bacterium]